MFEPLPSVAELFSDVMGEALVVFDPADGRVSFVNAAAAALFNLEDDLAGKRAADLVPAFEHAVAGEFTVRLGSGPKPRHLAVKLERLRSRSDAPGGAMIATMRLLEAEPAGDVETPPLAVVPAPTAPRKRSERLESLWGLVVRRGFAGSEQVRAILHESTRGMDMSNASLARVDGEELLVEFTTLDSELGERTPIDRSPARAALLRSGTFAVLDTRNDREFANGRKEVRSFMSVAFRVGEVRWVLTLSKREPRDYPFDDLDWHYIDDVVHALNRSIERRERDERFERLAYSDSLTSLPNRVALLSRLDEALDEAQRTGGQAAVMFLDIDGFKNVNDTVGHRGGDTVLAEVAHRLRGTLRKDEYIGRLGGDEFAVVMPQVKDREEIESIAHRIGGVLTYPFLVDEYRFSLSASIGVAVYPEDAPNRDDLLACADAAMYSAKDDGGSRVRFRDATGGFEEPLSAAAATESEAREAGYLLCYQPIVEITTGRVLAAEALIRRIHPLHGLLAPERGLSIARDDAGRRALDRWVLREAATQARTWEQAGSPVRIDVNLAAFEFAAIEQLLADEALAGQAANLRVEVTRDRFSKPEEAEQLAAFIENCAKRGIAFALDGFDGSLAALSSLAHLPIETVKMEPALADKLTGSRTARAIVEGTILVAKSLGWSVIAKGVESAAQYEALATLGCDGVQGFYVAHPMTAVDFGTWLRERTFIGRQV